ncbi:protein N-terminal asparagine amidohydrolase [Aplysia californica]|uniref:Protein N-terminal asparagine amidohydrolase n=1 Tax=Aplysia californica TaxID=6500 RepID=A0ABM0JFP0_APLCA|nr:protein N-terminal asparagine amidohydrolase [Aplysia californica]
MPLFIKGVKVEKVPTVDAFVVTYSHFKESSQDLLGQQIREVGPKGLLYIGQREVAGTSPADDVISVLGSEDATTCHIAVLRHSGSGATSLIHFDGSSIPEGLDTMVSLVKKQTADLSSGRFEVHLVGGFLDPRHNSHEVSDEVLDAMCNNPNDLHLVTACITHFNTTYDEKGVPFPVIYGIACDVKTGEIFRAKFTDKGPDQSLRSARHFTGGRENIVIYDSESKQLAIGPFGYDQLSNLDVFLSMPNKAIRQYLSTSPAQEPEGFEENVRASLLQMKNFPNPLSSFFSNGKPRTYKKDPETGAWILVQ